MRRARINKSGKGRENGVGIGIRVGNGKQSRINGKAERIRIGKSGRVETKLLGHITEFNAISGGCGVPEIALYFFESARRAAAAPLPLAADDVDFVQSFAIWPGAAQNRQSLLSRRRFRSTGVSLPSLPR